MVIFRTLTKALRERESAENIVNHKSLHKTGIYFIKSVNQSFACTNVPKNVSERTEKNIQPVDLSMVEVKEAICQCHYRKVHAIIL